MKENQTQQQPRTVPELERSGEIRTRWSWVEASVWTERMLEALERGVKGGKWHSLNDKVHGGKNLQAAWKRVKANRGAAGADKKSIHVFEGELDRNLDRLAEELRVGTYRPMPVRRVFIPKLGSHELRPLGIPAVRDRVVQTALRNVIEPIFESKFLEVSYGFRPGRGCKDALRRVDGLLKAGYRWVVDVDIEKYFDSIPHPKLMAEVAKDIADGRTLGLIEQYLQQGILEGMREWTPEQGTPQGAVISPLLANIYLHPVDQVITAAGYELVRYADDMVILCKTPEEAAAALALLRDQIEARGLRLHPTKTKIVNVDVRPGFQFLGYIFYSRFRDPRPPSVKKLKERIRERTRRTNGNSLKTIIDSINRVLHGWFEYFKHCSKNSFDPIDKWIRMRLRAILSKRRRRGRKRRRGRGFDHFRWPNAYFKEQGLFILKDARLLLIQSRRGNTTNWRAGCGRSACPVRREGER